jgi:hypothetical protein
VFLLGLQLIESGSAHRPAGQADGDDVALKGVAYQNP